MATGGRPITRIAQGALMGAANVVPGVSGGTLALMFGIYERLIAAIRDGARALARFARGDVRGGIERLKSVEWGLLLPLAGGAFVTVVVLAALPTAQNVYTYAARYQTAMPLARDSGLITTALAVPILIVIAALLAP